MTDPVRVAVVFHSVSGRTRALAEACARGATAVSGVASEVLSVEAASASAGQAKLAASDAIVLGCPTYMGSASAQFKAFMDATAAVWALQGWRDKLAAGFTHSAAPSGDKLSTLVQLAVFAAQHGMIWVPLGLPPTYALPEEAARAGADMNRLGSHLGAMAQSRPGGGVLPEGDLRTAEHLGRRVAEAVLRWRGQRDATASASAAEAVPARAARHPTAATWVFPPADRASLPAPLERTNLRELAARADRFEHCLMPCAVVGGAQLEVVTASEPLAFAHVNVSDEYALALPSGDDLVDGFPLRTFVSDPVTGEDVARYNHRSGDVILHPYGFSHWPARLRPPFAPFDLPPGMRRTGLMLVYCASVPTPPDERPLGAPPGREADVKAYAEPSPPLSLRSIHGEPGVLARVGRTSLTLVVRPDVVAPPRGGWVLVLESDPTSVHASCDLVRVPPGARLDGAGIARALVLTSEDAAPDPTPPVWKGSPRAPFAPFEDAAPGALPFEEAGVRVEQESDDADRFVSVAIGKGAPVVVPRHWLARMLFRCALHDLRLGYVETYGAFFVDDGGGPAAGSARVRVGVRGGDAVELDRAAAVGFVERMYRAVAPPGYTERLV